MYAEVNLPLPSANSRLDFKLSPRFDYTYSVPCTNEAALLLLLAQ